VQEKSADMWKENILEDLEEELLEYEIAGEFLADIKKEFGGEDEETVKVAELKRLEQREKTIEEFIQKFRRATKGSSYELKPLELGKRTNSCIRVNTRELDREPFTK